MRGRRPGGEPSAALGRQTVYRLSSPNHRLEQREGEQRRAEDPGNRALASHGAGSSGPSGSRLIAALEPCRVILGWHLLFDAQGAAPAELSHQPRLSSVLAELPRALGLTPVGAPQITQRPTLLVGLQLLAESHLSLHLRPQAGVVHADLFSCAPFDREHATALLLAAYPVTRHRVTWLERTLPGAEHGGA